MYEMVSVRALKVQTNFEGSRSQQLQVWTLTGSARTERHLEQPFVVV